ncbi:MAG: bifunctional DNA primase/polymerase [Nitrospinae bacterium]|nr:bifunctional DNA primase/polymerase [Nitrospinota bacterium]
MTNNNSSIMQAAIDYAAHGWPVIPLGGKKPRIRDWPNKATTEEMQIRRWWKRWPGANIGIVTGKRSGLFVLDVDVKSGGIENLDLLEASYGKLPDTLTTKTGGGGFHYIFNYPDDREILGSSGDLPSGIDVRGKGGQVVVHPSIHKNGNTYEWIDGEPGEKPIADAPQWLLDLITCKTTGNGNGKKRIDPQDSSEILEGERDATLFKLGSSMRGRGCGEEEIKTALLLHNQERCKPPLKEEQVLEKVQQAMKYPPGNLRVGPYEMAEFGIIYHKTNREGDVQIPLTNFQAHIVADVREDDGAEVNTRFGIQARLKGRNYKFSVPAGEFCSMGWVVRELGAGAILTPGASYKDNTRAAIQYLSGDIPTHTTYSHTGWRKIGGQWLYLNTGGPIGPEGLVEGVEVALEGKLNDYCLPAPPEGQQLINAVRASLELLHLAPGGIVYPLLASIYRAPLGEALEIDFSVFLAGPSGSQKSELTGMVQSHFGKKFRGTHLPGNWATTANALEKEAFTTKDCVFVVDDFCPRGTTADIARLNREADRLFRGQANRSGRGRMYANGELRPERYPRGLILSSGEDLPNGASLRARLLILEITNGAVKLEKLTIVQAQAEQGVFEQSMAGYVKWLAPRMNELKKNLPNEKIKIREYARRLKFNHDRTPDMLASLMPGLQYFLKFAQEVGAIDSARVEEEEAMGWKYLGEAVEGQIAYQAAEDPTRRFLDLISSAFSSGLVHAAAADDGLTPGHPERWGWRKTVYPTGDGDEDISYRLQGDRIGWVDDKENLFLEPEAAYATVQKIGKTQNAPITVTQQTLWKRLAEKGCIISGSDKGHHTIRKTIEGCRKRVIHLIYGPPTSPQAVHSVPSGPSESEGNGNNDLWTDAGDRFSAKSQKAVHQCGPQGEVKQGLGPNGPVGPPVQHKTQDKYCEGTL